MKKNKVHFVWEILRLLPGVHNAEAVQHIKQGPKYTGVSNTKSKKEIRTIIYCCKIK